MSETHAVSPASSSRTTDPSQLGLWLNIAIGVLLVAVLAVAAYFGWTVYQSRQRQDQANAALRVAKTIEEQVRKNPNDPVLRVRLGEALGAAGRYPEAVEQLNAALKINPKHTGALLDLGVIARLTGDEGKAINYFEKVVEITEKADYSAIDQSREIAFFNLGMMALEAERYEDAAGHFKAALRIRKDASDSYFHLAQALRGMDDSQAAIDNLEIALAFDPNYADALLLLGELYLEQGDKVNASYALYKASQIDKESGRPEEALAGLGPSAQWLKTAQDALAAGELAEGLDAALIARNLDPNSVEAVRVHGQILVKQKKDKDAYDVYLQALKLAPKDEQIQAEVKRLRAILLKKN